MNSNFFKNFILVKLVDRRDNLSFLYYREKFDNDVGDETFNTTKAMMPRTQHIMKGLRARLDLLLQVTIAPGEGIHVTRSISSNHENGMSISLC